MRAINQCTQYLWCMLPPPASNPNLYASSQEIQEPTNQTARFLCVLWTHKMNWDSFESKNGRLASHDFRPGLQSIRAVTGRTGRFRSRDNSVCANFNHLDPALYCDWYPAHLHFLPPSVLNICSRANCQKGWHWNSLSCTCGDHFAAWPSPQMVNAIPDTLPAIYGRCQKSPDAEKISSVMLHTAHSPPERVPAPSSSPI